MQRLVMVLLLALMPFGMALADNHDSGMDSSDQPSGEVARAMFTVGVENREPTLTVRTIPDGMNEVYFYTDLRDFQGQTVTHRWNFEGNVEAEVSFDVGGPRWRTWSLKTIPESQRGEWSVDIVDGEGFIVETHEITAR